MGRRGVAYGGGAKYGGRVVAGRGGVVVARGGVVVARGGVVVARGSVVVARGSVVVAWWLGEVTVLGFISESGRGRRAREF